MLFPKKWIQENPNYVEKLPKPSESINPVILKRQAFSTFPSFIQTGSCNLIGTIKAPTTKSVIVTGASRGIGRAVATRLAHDGFPVVVNFAGNSTKAEEVVAEIKGAGGQAIAVQADVANAADVERLFKEAVGTFGGINVVVNCAGIMPLSPIDRLDLDLFDKVINTNLRGTFVVLGQASRQLLSGGRIIASLVVLLAWRSLPTALISLPKRAFWGLSVCLPMSCVVVILP